MPVEYRVRSVTRYIVTRYHEEDGPKGKSFGSEQIGEYVCAEAAYSVGHALCDAERVRAGEPLDSPAFVYPGAESDEPTGMTIDLPSVMGRKQAKRMVRSVGSKHYWKR